MGSSHLATGVSGEGERRVPGTDTTPAVGVFSAELWVLMRVIGGGEGPRSPHGQSKVAGSDPAPIASLPALPHRSTKGGEPSALAVIRNEVIAWGTGGLGGSGGRSTSRKWEHTGGEPGVTDGEGPECLSLSLRLNSDLAPPPPAPVGTPAGSLRFRRDLRCNSPRWRRGVVRGKDL